MGDDYIKESCKSYQKCQVANCARRNSLTKKTIGIEVERKLASHQMDREERQLREHLRHMRTEQAKTSFLNGIRDKMDGESRNRKSQLSKLQESRDYDFIDPYPVTFPSMRSTSQGYRQRSNTMEDKAGLMYASCRGRRVSKEFEDLCLNTTTGKLAIPAHLLIHPVTSLGNSSSPSSTSPQRKVSASRSSLDSLEASHWPGDPEAIHSVRRPRKSVEQQDKDRLIRLVGDLSSE